MRSKSAIRKLLLETLQGSLHSTPEHCLVNGGFPLVWWKKPCFQMGKLYLLRSPVQTLQFSSDRDYVLSPRTILAVGLDVGLLFLVGLRLN